ncbi:hypothetical protein GGTG_00891 [Gaeumannomyces tritici R3-111a-1]|uniref:SWR1-complex protein 3 domain-containing protein n=1 Tax=Gaeumannomyces tritici (strain R3-111a-1) TaxID=644352 RepID=J3NI06_GAET3|nr:hypothetical protein GGTG_00891 [Gaeumannomyces tritici R3-111a-1]EJT80899.1 hypothetical protein GGTG_00891 [Gaeumannomyces tritici R3-111a-1]
MERKRKMPARAAARVEQASKKRTATPPDNRSATPVAAPPPPVEEPAAPPPQPLPKSVQPGKPLPVVDEPQPESLPSKHYQSIAESGVAGESLQRSRQKWLSEGIFEKYWTKPTKRKGVVIEEPNNPPKDSMSKLGTVTVTVEPHAFDAVMYAVKDPKPPAPLPPQRPVIQYGPSNGTMPPLSTSTPTPTAPPTPRAAGAQSPALPTANATTTQSAAKQDAERPASAVEPCAPELAATPAVQQDPSLTPAPGTTQPAPLPPIASPNPQAPPGQPSFPSRPPPPPPSALPAANGAPAPAAHPPGTDPIIAMLAHKATEDENLRDLMKRVAQGRAPKDELERFQAIIDQITAETKRQGSVQGPSAHRLLVNGRTVRYFADEVRAILDIVLTTNPRQTSADLRPPAKSDPLVVDLVKAALDEPETRDIVRRIAEDRPQFADATDLKLILDKLKQRLAAGSKEQQETDSPSQGPASGAPATVKPNGQANGTGAGTGAGTAAAPQQALRSKGPPPAPKPEISAVVFEFANGTGDRYLFPKFSILETIPSPDGVRLMASFLIVRKGSKSEYGVDPTLDYYQPVTVKLHSPSPKILDHLHRVVAPPEEVKRYMNNIMDTMTRAEYVLLAMRLPRDTGKDEKEGSSEKDAPGKASSEPEAVKSQPMDGVLWTAKATKPSQKPVVKAPTEDEQYQKFIASVTPMEVDDA